MARTATSFARSAAWKQLRKQFSAISTGAEASAGAPVGTDLRPLHETDLLEIEFVWPAAWLGSVAKQHRDAKVIALGEAETPAESLAFVTGERNPDHAADDVVDAEARGGQGDVFGDDSAIERDGGCLAASGFARRCGDDNNRRGVVKQVAPACHDPVIPRAVGSVGQVVQPSCFDVIDQLLVRDDDDVPALQVHSARRGDGGLGDLSQVLATRCSV